MSKHEHAIHFLKISVSELLLQWSGTDEIDKTEPGAAAQYMDMLTDLSNSIKILENDEKEE